MLDWTLGLLAVALAALAYLSGYAYLDGYYGFYGIDVHELGFSLQDVLVHSAPVIRAPLFGGASEGNWLYLPVIAFLAIVLLAICRYGPILKGDDDAKSLTINVSWTLFILACTAFASYAFLYAKPVGEENARLDLPKLSNVKVERAGGPSEVEDFLNGNPNWRPYFIAATSETYFIIVKPQNGERRWLFRLSPREAYSLRVFRD